MASSIRFSNADIRFVLGSKAQLRALIGLLFKQEGKELADLQYVFCSDLYLLDVNQRFLQHDYLTDIITFDLEQPGGEVVGEVYISVDRVKANAAEYGVPFDEELRRVMFHGALHLCGYKDKTKVQQRMMRSKEDDYLRLYGELYPTEN
jgi:rRNA maturation RNase YbeY